MFCNVMYVVLWNVMETEMYMYMYMVCVYVCM